MGGLGALDDSFSDVDLRHFDPNQPYPIDEDGNRPEIEPMIKATRRQASEGNPEAQRRLSAMLYLGLGVVKNVTEAYLWLERWGGEGE